MKKALTATGYDQEAAYFYERERELIAKQRRASGRSTTQLTLIQGGGKPENAQTASSRGRRQAA